MAFFQNLVSKLFGNSSATTPLQAPLPSTPTSSVVKEPFITINEEQLVCSYPSQNKTEFISWENINCIDVLTTDEGPYVCDVFILITDNNGGVAIPQDKEECKLVVDKIFKLPGFDFKQFTEAMGSTDNRKFNVWQKK